MNSLPKNVWILTLCQALMTSCASLVVFSGSLVGTRLAPSEKLSTLPVALLTIGLATSTVPVALLMEKLGRKKIFTTTALVGVLFAVFAAWSIVAESFVFFCIAVFLLGTTLAAVQQFRFAAMESVSTELIPKAASQVLLGGIAAAFIGPEVALRGKDLLGGEFAGSFVLLGLLFAISFFLLNRYQNTSSKKEDDTSEQRPLSVVARQPVFWVAVLGAVVGYAVMSFIMTATPISMHVMNHHSLENTKWVIQSHIMAMYLPSLITAWVIRKIGIMKMMLAGIVAYGICLLLAFSGIEFIHYWTALILLGVGWNFLFIGGTTLLPQSYSEGEKFKVQALNEFLVFGSQAIASISAGWVLFQLGWNNLLLINVPMLLLPIISILVWKYNRPQTA